MPVEFTDEQKAEMNRIVEERLARQKTALENEKTTALSAVEQKLNAANEQIRTLEQTSATAAEKDKVLDQAFAGLLEGMDENAKKRIDDPIFKKLSVSDRIQYINTHRADFYKAPATSDPPPPAPGLPPADPHRTNSGTVTIPGGWKSWTEFAVNDPGGASKFKAEHPDIFGK